MYSWQQSNINSISYLLKFKQLLNSEHETVQLYYETGQKVNRMTFDGTVTFEAVICGQPVGIIYNDFRVFGGSFGRVNSDRICAFIKEMEKRKQPILFFLDSFGVRISDGRSVFKNAFLIVKAIRDFCRENLLITCSIGNSLGIAAIFAGVGDYHLAIKEKSLINLTGPSVIELFFDKSIDFQALSSAERHVNKNRTVHYLADSESALFQKVKSIFSFLKGTYSPIISNDYFEQLPMKRYNSKQREQTITELKFILLSISDSFMPIFQGLYSHLYTFLIRHKNRCFGLFINPPFADNMLTTDDLALYNIGLNFFRKLKLPVVSIVDTPGADPREEQNDQGIFAELAGTAVSIIDYPYPKLGIAYGRCYGGASVLSFPYIFGGKKNLAIKGAQIGAMDGKIISHLLKGSARLLNQWEINRENETEDMADLIKEDIVEACISKKELPFYIDRFLTEA